MGQLDSRKRIRLPATEQPLPASIAQALGIFVFITLGPDPMKKVTALEIIRWSLLTLFLYAAVTKLLSYEKFKVQLGQSPLLTEQAYWVAWAVPALEIVIVLMLAIPALQLLALYASYSLMVMFTTYIIIITRFSPYVPCSCGGVLQKLGWTEHLVFNIVFVVLAAIAIILHVQNIKKTKSPQPMT
jgi:uncharacterized membrane protein YphA (DoxX/SURF4 family)